MGGSGCAFGAVGNTAPSLARTYEAGRRFPYQWLTKLEENEDSLRHHFSKSAYNIRNSAKKGRDSVLSLSKLSSHGPHQPSRERQATFLPSPLQIHRLHPKEPIGRCIDFKTPACLCPSNIAATPFIDYVPFSPNQASPRHLQNYRRIFINILSSPVLPFCHPSDS